MEKPEEAGPGAEKGRMWGGAGAGVFLGVGCGMPSLRDPLEKVATLARAGLRLAIESLAERDLPGGDRTAIDGSTPRPPSFGGNLVPFQSGTVSKGAEPTWEEGGVEREDPVLVGPGALWEGPSGAPFSLARERPLRS